MDWTRRFQATHDFDVERLLPGRSGAGEDEWAGRCEEKSCCEDDEYDDEWGGETGILWTMETWRAECDDHHTHGRHDESFYRSYYYYSNTTHQHVAINAAETATRRGEPHAGGATRSWNEDCPMSAFVRSKRTTSGIRLAAPSLESYTADSRRRYSWEAFRSIQFSSAPPTMMGHPPRKEYN